MMIFVYVCSTCSMVELKALFETWITRNCINGVNFFHLSYLITLTVYLCSQWAPNVQIKYFMCDLSIYRLFVLNRCWKRDSLQMMIIVYICSTCSVVELKTHFETWIASVVNNYRLRVFLNLIIECIICYNFLWFVWRQLVPTHGRA
jgi:hypothetical protein